MLKVKNTYSEEVEGETVLEVLGKCRVMAIFHTTDGFSIGECCDDFYCVKLSKEQVLQLAQELIDFVNAPPKD